MVKDDDDDEQEEVKADHNHKAVNAKTYCKQTKNKWRDLQGRAAALDAHYDVKIKELGNLCSSMFEKIGGSPISI